MATVFLGSEADLDGFEERPKEGEKMRLKLRVFFEYFQTVLVGFGL